MEIIYHESKRKKETTQSSDADKKMPGRFYLNRTCEIFIRKIFFAQMNTVNTRNKKTISKQPHRHGSLFLYTYFISIVNFRSIT